MTTEEQFLKTFEARVRQLMFQYDQLEKTNAHLLKTIEQKDAVIAEKDNEIARLKQDYANLKLARMIQIGDDEIHDAKRRVSKLVREVDKCIALLKV